MRLPSFGSAREVDEDMIGTGCRSGDRNKVGGDRAILDRGLGYLRRGDRYTLDRWLGPQGSGGGVIPPPSHDGQSILTWPNNYAGNPSYLTGSGSTAPIYKEKIVNGHPVARFSSATGSIMTIFGAVGLFPANLPWTVMAVMRVVPGKVLYGFHGAITYAPVLSSVPPLRFYALDQAFQFWIDPNGDLPQCGDGNFHLFVAQSAPTTYEMEVDGNHIVHGYNASPNSDNYTHVGHGDSDGDIAALLYYRADVAATDLANLRAYFGNKYALPVLNPGTPVMPDTIAGLYGWFEADSIFP